MKKIILLIFVVKYLVGYSQNENFIIGNGVNGLSGTFNNSTRGWTIKNKSIPKEKVLGTPYLFENWKTSGTISTDDNKTYNISNLNYDAEKDTFVVRISNDSIFMFKPNYLLEVVINNRIFKKYLNQDNHMFDYYEVIGKGKNFSLLKRNVKSIRKGIINHLTMTKDADYYILKYNYFIYKNGIIKPFKLKKSNILGLIEKDKVKGIEKFIKDYRLSYKKEMDVRKILNYLSRS